MSLLTVGPTGLRTLAKHCEGASTNVAVTGAPGVPSGSIQATAAAAGAVHSNTGLAGGELSTRMGTHATDLNTAASGFTSNDAHDAAALAGLAPGV